MKGVKVAEAGQFESFDSFFCDVEMSSLARLELEYYRKGVPPSAGGIGHPKRGNKNRYNPTWWGRWTPRRGYRWNRFAPTEWG